MNEAQRSDECYQSLYPIEEAIMRLCKTWAEFRSKDPRTKVGAAVYQRDSGALFLGYNGFPKGFPDKKLFWDNRDSTSSNCKYKFVKHAESNAIDKATAALGINLSNCILISTNHPCHACMRDSIAPRGIKTIYYASEHPIDPESDLIAKELEIQMHILQLSK